VIRDGPKSAAEASKQTGLPPAEIAKILERLVALQYLSKAGARYKAEARPRGL
jgi:DNA-binding IclR family transcriptional regulator